MKRILNFAITVLILWIGNTYFHDYVAIETTKTLIIASLLMFGIDLIVASIFIVLICGVAAESVIASVLFALTIPLLFILTPIKLYLISFYLDGFKIYGGFWIYLILTIIFGYLKISDKDKKGDKK